MIIYHFFLYLNIQKLNRIIISLNPNIKFADIKCLNIIFYNKGIFPTSNKIIINIENNYNYKFNIKLDKSLEVYDYDYYY